MFEWNSFLVGTNWIVGHGYGEKKIFRKRKKNDCSYRQHADDAKMPVQEISSPNI